MAKLQGKVSGHAQVTLPLGGRSGTYTAFHQEYIITTLTIPLFLKLNSAWGVVKFKLWFVIVPRKRKLIDLVQQVVRQVSSTDVMDYLRRTVTAPSQDGAASGMMEYNRC